MVVGSFLLGAVCHFNRLYKSKAKQEFQLVHVCNVSQSLLHAKLRLEPIDIAKHL